MKYQKNIIALFMVFLSFSVFGGSSEGVITRLYVHTPNPSYGNSAGVIMFSAGTHNNKPACSTIGDEWAVSLENEYGRAMYSLLLSASAMDKTIYVSGEAACNGWSDRESPKYIRIDP